MKLSYKLLLNITTLNQVRLYDRTLILITSFDFKHQTVQLYLSNEDILGLFYKQNSTGNRKLNYTCKITIKADILPLQR